MIVTIDGPAGSGKTSVSRSVAERLGMCVLDTGSMYRTCALATLRAGGDPASPCDVIKAVRGASIQVVDDGSGRSRMMLDGEDVTGVLHEPEIDLAVTPVCQVPEVRDMMVAMQREFASNHDTICEGRDMGTVVFPGAEVKIWLTADDRTRAMRRVGQFGNQDAESVLADIRRRDEADAGRSLSPMVAAADAVLIDTTDMSFQDVVDGICLIIGS